MAKKKGRAVPIEWDWEEPKPESSNDGGGKEGFVSSPMYSRTWNTPADRRSVERRNWRKEEEDCG
jgi:hypothetical protein